jgi:hypothetical protein
MDPKSLEAVQAIAQSLQPHLWPQSFADLAQVAFCILTVVTLYYLRRYTIETVELRKAATEQLAVTQNLLTEAHDQNEWSTTPFLLCRIVMFNNFFNLQMENAGGGPALNIAFDPIVIGSTAYTIQHSDALQAGGETALNILKEGRPPMILHEFVAGAKALMPTDLRIVVKYDSFKGIHYETECKLDLNGGTGGLVLRYEGFRRVGGT